MSSIYSDDWEYHINKIQTNVKIDNKRRKQLIESLTVLRRNLGEDWLRESKYTKHPILWSIRTIHGKSSSDNLLLIWGNAISALEGLSDFDKILDKIKKACLFDSAESELEVGYKLARNGYQLEIEQEVENKRPDFFCKKDKLKFFVEVKTLITADETEKARKTSIQIMTACRPIFPAGIIFKPLSDSCLKEIQSILREKTEQAIRKNTGIEVDIPKILKLYLVPDDAPDRIKKYKRWCNKQEKLHVIPKGSHGLMGPIDSTRQDQRAKTKMKKFRKEGQIPVDKMGILILVGNFSFWSVNVESFVNGIIKKNTYKLKNIPAVVLISTKIFSDTKPNVVEKEDFIHINNCLYGDIREEIVIVKNKFCEFKFDYNILKDIFLET